MYKLLGLTMIYDIDYVSEIECHIAVWSEVQCWSEVSYIEVLREKKACTLVWPYTKGNWLYYDTFIWFVSCSVVDWTGFVMCGFVDF